LGGHKVQARHSLGFTTAELKKTDFYKLLLNQTQFSSELKMELS
jgi:hypothetical protein